MHSPTDADRFSSIFSVFLNLSGSASGTQMFHHLKLSCFQSPLVMQKIPLEMQNFEDSAVQFLSPALGFLLLPCAFTLHRSPISFPVSLA